MRRDLVFLFGLTAAIAVAGCHGRRRGVATEDIKGVGFELPGAAHVARGAIVTTPPGREEAFLAFVAGQAPGWVDACLAESGTQAPQFGFRTGDKGGLEKVVVEAGDSARERCLAARAVAAAGTTLPGNTQVRV